MQTGLMLWLAVYLADKFHFSMHVDFSQGPIMLNEVLQVFSDDIMQFNWYAYFI